MAMQKISRVSGRRSNQPPRSRAFFLEMLLNMLIFALCAVVALQVFVEGKTTTSASEALTTLTLDAESLAETYKASDGDLATLTLYTPDEGVKGEMNSAGALVFYYDGEFEPTTAEGARHSLVLTPTQGSSSLVSTVEIAGYTGDTQIFSLEVTHFKPEGRD